ncbi:MAG TPA: hypothetical protein VGQ76_26910 [Thermoanaerobaculia bacterium]|jgi:hypothetical protein|nr:hypothetical protein [Thermoanaerobaculia bacterium]
MAARKRRCNGARHAIRNTILHGEQIACTFIEMRRPERLSIGGSQQPHGDAHALSAALNAAVEHRLDAELASRDKRALIEFRIAANRARRTDDQAGL